MEDMHISTNFFDPHNQEERSNPMRYILELIQRLESQCIVCSKAPLNCTEVSALLSSPFVEGVILKSDNRELLNIFSSRLGFFIKDGHRWDPPMRLVLDVIYLGSWTEFGARFAWFLYRSGVRRIYSVSFTKGFEERSTIRVLIERTLASLVYRLWRKLGANNHASFAYQKFFYSINLLLLKDFCPPVSVIQTTGQRGRIVMVCGSLGPGGAERQLTNTFLGLVAHGFDDAHLLYHLPMYKPNNFFLPHFIEAGVTFSQLDKIPIGDLISAGVKAGLLKHLGLLGDLGDEVTAHIREFIVRKPEIVHAWLDHVNVVAGLAALLAGVPRIILSCRSVAPIHFALNQPYMRPIYSMLAKYPHVTLLNNSEAGAESYCRWLGISRSRIDVIKNGYDFSALPMPQELPYLRSEYRYRLGIPADAPVIGVIMRFSEEKRPFLWLEVARLVAHQIPKAHFVMIGDGPMRYQVQKIAHEALQERCHFPGHEGDIRMPLASMDIFLLTSRAEGLPNVLIEAQALGVVPVAINVGGVTETLVDGDTGWLVNKSDPNSSAKKVIELLNDKEAYRHASTRASEFVRSRFSQDRMIEQTLRVYGY
jgi:glycosyltransferase involved in cell wall biosynthesis